MIELVGTTLGNYKIEAVLGNGAMGEVFRGLHLYLNRRAAIKVMHPHLAADPSFRQRFEQEAQSAAALNHPNIISIQVFGQEEQRLFLVMELAGAGSLRTLLQQQPANQRIPIALGVDLVAQAADGLAYAHDHGMVHRDIKPDNLLLNATPGAAPDAPGAYTVKVCDFGLAKLAESETGMTATGVMMGTPAYMSPEQAQGLPLDARTDIYALGVVLYEVATGYPPFQTTSLSEAVYKHVYAPPPPPRSVRPDLDPQLEQIILKCLAKKPDERYATATELAAALRGLRLGLPVQQGPAFVAPAYAATVLTPIESVLPPVVPTMPGGITVTLGQSALAAVPGQAATLSVNLAAQTPDPETVVLTVEGIPPNWAQGLGRPIPLAPNGPVRVDLGIIVPRSGASRSASYPVTVRAASVRNPAIAGAATCTLNVQPFSADLLSISPRTRRSFGDGAYTVTVHNGGNIPADYSLAATDTQGRLTFQFSQPGVHLEPGQSGRVPLRVGRSPIWQRPSGQDFTVQARSAAGLTPAVPARYVHVPTAIGAVPKVLYAALLLVVVATGVLFSTNRLPGIRPPWVGTGVITQRTPLPTRTPHTLAWRAGPPLPTGRFALAAAISPDGHIYAIGGNAGSSSDNQGTFYTEVDVLTPGSTSWTQVAQLTRPRGGLGAAAGADGRIYAIEGTNGNTIMNSVEAYDPANNVWKLVGNLDPNLPRYRVAVVATPDGQFYVIGGDAGRGSVNRVEVYRQTGPSTNFFGTRAALTTPRAGSAAVVAPDGRILVFGGHDAQNNTLNTAEAYVPATNSWQPIAPMPTARYRAAAAVGPDGKIYVMGGRTSDNVDLNSVDIYDPTTNTWSSGPRMAQARDALAAITAPDGSIYVIGGRSNGAAINTVEVLR